MASGIAGIDHAIIGVRDLERARASYQRLGFRLTPRGRHAGWGTANYCLMFPADYIELLGVIERGEVPAGLARFLAEREGLLGLALRTTDPEATRAAWADAGLEPDDVADLRRLLEPDVELRFQNVMLDPAATAGVPLFACAHLTPEPMRSPAWLDHPNGACGIASITAVVEDPAAVYPTMAKVFGAASLTETDDTLAVHTGTAVLMFATPDDLDMLHPELDASWIEGEPMLAALTVLVRDLAATADLLETNGVPHRRHPGGAIGVAPAHAHGVMLEFVLANVAS